MDNNVLKKVEAILAPGTLGEKYDEIGVFCGAGYSIMFHGAVNWRLSLPRQDKNLKGDAESLDEAFSQIHSLLAEMLRDNDPASPVTLSVKEKQHDTE